MSVVNDIAIVSAVYPPEPVVSANISHDVAIELCNRGIEVTVVCPRPSRPIGAEYLGCCVEDEVVDDGVRILRVGSFTAPAGRILERAWESWSFGAAANAALRRLNPHPDLLYANTWPMLGQALVARQARAFRIPLVLHIQDVYPESLLGKLPKFVRRSVRLSLQRVDAWYTRRAALTVVASDDMRETYIQTRRISPARIAVCRNWQDERLFMNNIDMLAARTLYGIAHDEFVFLYLGNIGPVAGVDFLIEAFANARLPCARLVIAGGGSAREAAMKRAKEVGSAITFISDPNLSSVPIIQSIANVLLLPTRSTTGTTSTPSKLAAYLFSQRPIIATVDFASDVAKCIREAACGWVGRAEDFGWLVARMREAIRCSEFELTEMGQRGRIYGLQNFSRRTGTIRLADLIVSAASDSHS